MVAPELTLTTEIEPGLPLIDLDAGRIAQVVRNLLSNAIRHTPAGGRVAVSARVARIHRSVEVGDSGSGIAPELLPRVFDRFVKGSGPSGTAASGWPSPTTWSSLTAARSAPKVRSVRARPSKIFGRCRPSSAGRGSHRFVDGFRSIRAGSEHQDRQSHRLTDRLPCLRRDCGHTLAALTVRRSIPRAWIPTREAMP